MPLTTKQVRLIRLWLFLCAAITIFPPHITEYRSELINPGLKTTFITSSVTITHSFILSNRIESSTLDAGIGSNKVITPKGIHLPSLLCELMFISFIFGFLFVSSNKN